MAAGNGTAHCFRLSFLLSCAVLRSGKGPVSANWKPTGRWEAPYRLNGKACACMCFAISVAFLLVLISVVRPDEDGAESARRGSHVAGGDTARDDGEHRANAAPSAALGRHTLQALEAGIMGLIISLTSLTLIGILVTLSSAGLGCRGHRPKRGLAAFLQHAREQDQLRRIDGVRGLMRRIPSTGSGCSSSPR